VAIYLLFELTLTVTRNETEILGTKHSRLESVYKVNAECSYITHSFYNRAAPNAGHFALAQMEEMGLVHHVITQV
jgi:NAD-dependent SIR2 family protein deacetylase